MALVYVADDEPSLNEMMTEMLQDAGHDVVVSPDGATLLLQIAKKRPDLVLLDINMPGMTGWEVKARLDPTLPVIAVTAQGGPSVERSALQTLRFAGFVRKPFRMMDLLATVDKALALESGKSAPAE